MKKVNLEQILLLARQPGVFPNSKLKRHGRSRIVLIVGNFTRAELYYSGVENAFVIEGADTSPSSGVDYAHRLDKLAEQIEEKFGIVKVREKKSLRTIIKERFNKFRNRRKIAKSEEVSDLNKLNLNEVIIYP